MLLAVAGISTALADPRSFHAGIARITVQDTTPFDALIAYPTEAAEVSVEEGLFRLSASRDAPVAAGRASLSSCFHTAAAGARGRRWFIAIFCFTSRGKVSSSSRRSIPQPSSLSSIGRDTIHKALDAALADPRFSNRADPDRIGMVGFSFGGAVTLIVAGAIDRSGAPVGLLP